MAVKLRSQRFGSTKRPSYRVVATDSRSPRDGRFLEIIGTYNPIDESTSIKLDEEKALKWLNLGAQPSDTVKSMLVKTGLWAKFNQTKSTK